MNAAARRLADAHPDMPAILTPQQVADLLSVPVRTVMAWRNDSRYSLNGSKFGKHVRFRKDEVFEFIAASADNRGAA